MRIDKNILYILAFFGLMLIVNSLIISPMKEENRDLALQIESIKNNDGPDDQDMARSIRKSKKGPDMARDLGLYEMSNKDLSIESMEVMEGNEPIWQGRFTFEVCPGSRSNGQEAGCRQYFLRWSGPI